MTISFIKVLFEFATPESGIAFGCLPDNTAVACNEPASNSSGTIIMAMNDPDAIVMALSHNDPTSDALKATACTMIQEAETTILQLDNEISRLESAIEDLKHRRSDTAAKIRQYQSTFAPHRIVPNEILGEIFSYCNSGSVIIPWELDTPPWTISYVCKKWRSIVLGTHSLWQNIEIQDRRRCPRIIDMSTEVIHRGGNRHLSMRTTRQSGYEENRSAIFDVITTNFACFEHLSIGGTPSELRPVMTLPPGSAKELQRLEIICYRSEELPDELPELPRMIFLGGVTLQGLNIHYANIPSALLLQLSLSKITVLRLHNISLESDDMLTVLSRCPLIKECAIGVQAPLARMPSTQKSKSVAVPCLETLRIDLTNSTPPSFLSGLIMPRLSDFCFYSNRTHEWEMAFTLALSHSGRLQSFQAPHLSSISAADLDILLPAIPDIQRLAFSDVRLSTQTLQGIASGALLSKIQESYFRCVMYTLEELYLHLDMLEQRFDRNSNSHNGFLRLGLPSLWQWNSNPDSDQALAMRRLRAMRAAGWRIDWAGIA